MVGVAVNVMDVPTHIGLALAAIVILTGRLGFTVIVMELDNAGFPVAHVALEVSSHEITSPLEGIYEKVGELAPTLMPFTFHW